MRTPALSPEPRFIDAEQAFLGCLMLWDAHGASVFAQSVRYDDFTVEHHKVILGAIVAVTERGDCPEVTIVLEEIRRQGFIQQRFWPAETNAGVVLHDLVCLVTVPESIGRHLQSIYESGLRRLHWRAGVLLAQHAEAGSLVKLAEIVDNLNGDIRAHAARSLAVAARLKAVGDEAERS